MQSLVGEDNEIEKDQMINKKKSERTDRESLDEDSKEEDRSLDDNNSSKNDEIFSEEREIVKKRDSEIVEELKGIKEVNIMDSLSKAIIEEENMGKLQKDKQRKDRREGIVNKDNKRVKVANNDDSKVLLLRYTVKIVFKGADINLVPCIQKLHQIFRYIQIMYHFVEQLQYSDINIYKDYLKQLLYNSYLE